MDFGVIFLEFERWSTRTRVGKFVWDFSFSIGHVAEKLAVPSVWCVVTCLELHFLKKETIHFQFCLTAYYYHICIACESYVIYVY